MKYLVFLLMFVPLSIFSGLLLALLFWSWKIGLIGAGFVLAVSADVCFHGSE